MVRIIIYTKGLNIIKLLNLYIVLLFALGEVLMEYLNIIEPIISLLSLKIGVTLAKSLPPKLKTEFRFSYSVLVSSIIEFSILP